MAPAAVDRVRSGARARSVRSLARGPAGRAPTFVHSLPTRVEEEELHVDGRRRHAAGGRPRRRWQPHGRNGEVDARRHRVLPREGAALRLEGLAQRALAARAVANDGHLAPQRGGQRAVVRRAHCASRRRHLHSAAQRKAVRTAPRPAARRPAVAVRARARACARARARRGRVRRSNTRTPAAIAPPRRGTRSAAAAASGAEAGHGTGAARARPERAASLRPHGRVSLPGSQSIAHRLRPARHRGSAGREGVDRSRTHSHLSAVSSPPPDIQRKMLRPRARGRDREEKGRGRAVWGRRVRAYGGRRGGGGWRATGRPGGATGQSPPGGRVRVGGGGGVGWGRGGAGWGIKRGWEVGRGLPGRGGVRACSPGPPQRQRARGSKRGGGGARVWRASGARGEKVAGSGQ